MNQQEITEFVEQAGAIYENRNTAPFSSAIQAINSVPRAIEIIKALATDNAALAAELGALRDSAPKVLTILELNTSAPLAAYLEIRYQGYEPCTITRSSGLGLHWRVCDQYFGYFDAETYGRNIRVWNDKPTADQMASMPWMEG